jgi:hypothetical protein
MIFALEGTTGNTATVSLWALDESTWNQNSENALDPAVTALRRWYLVASGIALTVGQLAELLVKVAPGTFYVQVTTAPAADGVVKVVGR